MKRNLVTAVAVLFLLGVIGFSSTLLMGPGPAHACGWGQSTGGGYVPQERNADGSGSGSWLDRFTGQGNAYASPSMTKEQAFDVIQNHVKKLNPSLKVGEITDAGSTFQADVMGEDNSVVERVAVDKQSGSLMPIQ